MSMIYRVVDTETGKVVDVTSIVILGDGTLLKYQIPPSRTIGADLLDQSRYEVQKGFEHEGKEFYEGDIFKHKTGYEFVLIYDWLEGWRLVDRDGWVMVLKLENINELEKINTIYTNDNYIDNKKRMDKIITNLKKVEE